VAARLLLVEDTPSSRDLMTYILDAYGHDVVAVAGGEAALLEARRRAPDLVVMDLQLKGGIDGYETLARLRGLPGLDRVPVVAVTAFAMVGDREHVLAAGFDAYLAKPIDPASFVTAIEGHLPAGLRGRRRDRRHLVLLVDDSPSTMELMRTLLAAHGHRVAVAEALADAQRVLRAQAPDLILCDLQLDRELGTDLYAWLREQGHLAGARFAFVSSSVPRQETVPEGVPVIRHPIEPEDFLAAVDRLLAAPVPEPQR
jgi:two-component system, cell cycle response regulator